MLEEKRILRIADLSTAENGSLSARRQISFHKNRAFSMRRSMVVTRLW